MIDKPEHVKVSVALILDEQQNLLWTWDSDWGVFALPMSRQRVGPNYAERAEPAAQRAALALGVPVQVGAHHVMEPT